MRSRERDETGLTIFSGWVIDAPAGTGVASPGIPFTYTRTGTGTYTVRFDSALKPSSVIVGGAGTGTTRLTGTLPLAGAFSVYVENPAGALANGDFSFTVTALDKRT